jgi:hypothetical protein
MRFRIAILSSLCVTMFQGCGSDHSDQIVDLQKQLALLSRQVEQDRKEINELRTADTGLRQSLGTAEAELNRLKALETPPPARAKGTLDEEDLDVTQVPMPRRRLSLPAQPQSRKSFSVATVQPQKTAISCSQVWALLGQGRNAADAAKALRTTVDRVHSCEQQVGRSRGR